MVPNLPIVVGALSLGFHAAKPHANPRVQLMEHFTTREEVGSKVLSRSPNNSVELNHPVDVEIVFPTSEFPYLVFELLHRLGPHAARTAGQGETQKCISLSEGGHFRFLPAQLTRDRR